MSLQWVVVSFSIATGRRGEHLGPGTVKNWLGTALNNVPNSKVSLLASAGPAGVLLCFRDQSIEIPRLVLVKLVQESKRYPAFNARAAVARGEVRVVQEDWLSPNFEGAPAIVASRLIASANDGELLLHESVASEWNPGGALKAIPGKHSGETFLAQRLANVFPKSQKAKPAPQPKSPSRVKAKALVARSRRKVPSALSEYVTRYRARLGGRFDRMEMKLLGTVTARDDRGLPISPTFDSMYVPLRVAERVIATNGDLGRPLSLRRLLSSKKPTIVIGAGGSGKTTWSRYLFRTLLRDPTALPILLVLRDVGAAWKGLERNDPNCSLDSFLESQLAPDSLSDGLLSQVLAHSMAPKPVLIVDGWDELGPMGDSIREKLIGFMREYPRVRVVATSRPYGDGKPTGADNFEELYVQPLSSTEIVDLAGKFFRACYGADLRQMELRVLEFNSALKHLPEVAALVRTPLLLSMMLSISRTQTLPDRRYKLYGACIDNLLTEVPTTYEKEGVQSRQTLWRPDDSDQRKQAVAALAWKMQSDGNASRGRASIPRPREEMKSFLPINWTDGEKDGFLSWLVERAGVVVDRADDTLMFAHLSFQEFLAAWHLKATERGDEKVAAVFKEKSAFGYWWETLRLAAALLQAEGGAGPLLRSLTDHREEGVWLAATLYADGLGDDSEFQRWIETMIGELGTAMDHRRERSARAWLGSRGKARLEALRERLGVAAESASWMRWQVLREWLNLSGISESISSPKTGIGAWVSQADAPTGAADAKGIALSRLWLSANPLHPGGKVGLLHLWPGSRRIRGIQLQAAIVCGASRSEIIRLVRLFRPVARAADPVEADALRVFLRYARDELRMMWSRRGAQLSEEFLSCLGRDFVRRLGIDGNRMTNDDVERYFRLHLRPTWRPRFRRFSWDAFGSSSRITGVREFSHTFAVDALRTIGVARTDEIAERLGLPVGAAWVSAFAQIEATHALGQSAVRAILLLGAGPKSEPELRLLARAVRRSCGGSDLGRGEQAELAGLESTDRLWQSLARLVSRELDPETLAFLEDAVRFPEKLAPPLSWGLQFLVRGDVLWADGTTTTLDDLCKEAGVPALPYVEEMAPEIPMAPAID